ncbi:MAG TPA: ATP-binding protein [Anaerolineales bacterium]|nr:ATP-binding protein [Anaerolineales bacterium]
MLLNFWQRLINVQVPDPDDARRRRLLNIILVGVTVTTAFILLVGLLTSLSDPLTNRFLLFGPIFIAFSMGLYAINRSYSGLWASLIFIGLLTILILFSDSASELVAGRSLFFFSIPIVFASVLLRPWMSFAMAFVCALAITVLSTQNGIPINTFAIGGFILLALFSWLSSSGIENALQELRTINQELDDRVAIRTEELAYSNERLKELDRIRAKFVADVSHELRTPVGNLVAYLEMLEEKIADPDRRKRYVGVLREEAARLQGLVNSVLNLSRLELGTHSQDYKALSLNEVVEQIVLANTLRAETHGLKMTFVPQPGQNPIIWTDKNLLTQVCNNVIGNAVNYTKPGGTVTVKTWQEPESVVFEVSDTGIGIAPEDLPYLFERFYRGKNAGSSTIPGSGLGLAITKEIMDRHKGSIEVTSEYGKGTTFRIVFPVYKGNLDPSPNPETAEKL